MLQILQRLQQHNDDDEAVDEAELADTATDSADDPNLELSEHIQQQLSTAVRICMKQLPGRSYISHSNGQMGTLWRRHKLDFHTEPLRQYSGLVPPR